jgi:hypothetical protein
MRQNFRKGGRQNLRDPHDTAAENMRENAIPAALSAETIALRETESCLVLHRRAGKTTCMLSGEVP